MAVTTFAIRTDWLEGDGDNKNWPFDFPIQGADDVLVEVRDAEGAITEHRSNLSLITDEDDTGYVIYPSVGAAIASGSQVRISRELEFTQPAQIGSQGRFNPEVHERALDRLLMQIQQLADVQSRAITVDFSPVPTLPEPEENYLLAWDADGNLTNFEGVTADQVAEAKDARDEAVEAAEAAAGIVLGDIGAAIAAASAKTTPVDTDLLGLVDTEASNALKKFTWANLKARLITFFDAVYQPIGNYQPLDPILTATEESFLTEDAEAIDALGSMANRDVTISTDDPSGGVDGDVWFKVAS